MRHLVALAVKFVAVAAVLSFMLPMEMGPVPWTVTATLALITTAVSYLVGDLAILPATGQVTAFFADMLLAAVTLWALQFAIPGLRMRFGDALVAAVALSLVEFFFHRYMQSGVLRTRRSPEQK